MDIMYVNIWIYIGVNNVRKLLENETNKKIIVYGSITALLLGLYNVYLTNLYGINSLEGLFFAEYGFVDIKMIKYVTPFLKWVLPQMILMWILKEFVAGELDKSGVYIFTRTNRRGKWVIDKTYDLFKFVILFYFIMFLITYIIGTVVGYKMLYIYKGIELILTIFILTVLLNYEYILIINILSLKMDVLYSFLIALFVDIFSLLLSSFIYEYFKMKIYLLKLLPVSHGILAWHSMNSMYNNLYISEFSIKNFSIIDSISYLILSCFIIVIYGIYVFQHKDII